MATIVRWNPFREMAAMQSALDRLFEDTWRSSWPSVSVNTLAFDVIETDQEYQVMVALPGLTADDISVRFEDSTLTISAELPQPKTPENARVIMQERTFGKFSRSIRLPQPINLDKVEARYENGVLSLHLPKAEEVQPKVIPVKPANLLKSKN